MNAFLRENPGFRVELPGYNVENKNVRNDRIYFVSVTTTSTTTPVPPVDNNNADKGKIITVQ